MRSQVLDPETARSLDTIGAGIDALHAAGVEPANSTDAITLVSELEVMTRRIDATKAELFRSIDTRGLHRADGHGSPKIMIRHVAGLSAAEAAGRARTANMLADLPDVDIAYRAGAMGTDQVRLLGRIHANRRVRSEMPERQAAFVDHAQTLEYRDFALVVRQWERLSDQDGTCDTNEANHEHRDAKLIQNPFDLSWELGGSYGAFQGAAMREIFDHYIDAELRADWEKTRAEHGEAACADDLGRSDAQRRADALWQIFQDAAATPPGATAPAVVHNIIWDAATYETMIATICGDQPHEHLDPDTYRCSTMNGAPLEPTEAAADSLTSKVRHAIVDTGGTITGLSRRGRLFTGLARHGVKLQSTTCIWPGCHAPTGRCEADHLTPHSQGGRTNPENGAPLCGRHNRWKQKGFTTHRGPSGTWHTYRPDGTKIP